MTSPGKHNQVPFLSGVNSRLHKAKRRTRRKALQTKRLVQDGAVRAKGSPLAQASTSWIANNAGSLSGRDLAGEILAGAVSALVTIAYCISFSALIFKGDLQAGLAPGLWGLLMGAAVTGLYVALKTSLVPATAGPDTPAVAVMSVLAASVGGSILSLHSGGPLSADAAMESAIMHVLLAMSVATVVTGVSLYLIGKFGFGQLVRFVPYPVIGGFLAASGWLIISGAVELVTGQAFRLSDLPQALPREQWGKIALAIAFAATVIMLKRKWNHALVVPASFFAAVTLLNGVLWLLMVPSASGWYIAGAAQMQAWLPLAAVFGNDIEWTVLLSASVEIGAVAGVTLLALLLDVSSLEVARAKAADLDAEFRDNGVANVIAAPLGGLLGNLSMQSSRLLEETGASTRLGGVTASLAIGLVLVTGIDLPALIPAPLLAGLLIYLGLLILREALLEAPGQRAWTDLAAALLIMFAIVQFGYLVGVVMGFVGACLMFAFSYSRIGVIRRHLTRAQFSSHVERAAPVAKLLREEGAAIHVFWLSGFIFFGSSNGVFERLRRQVENARERPVRYIILDFAAVSGFDTSAVLSLVKLRNFCDERGVTLLYAGLSVTMLVALEQAGLFGAGAKRRGRDQGKERDGGEERDGGNRRDGGKDRNGKCERAGDHRAFPTRNEALEWCEDQLLQMVDRDGGGRPEAFDSWLEQELGKDASSKLIARYFERKDVAAGITLYQQGEASDTIDLVAAGSIAIWVKDESGGALRLRRMFGQTVVGEMGFFRGSQRAASVSSEGPTVVYTMDQAAFQKMKADEPELAVAFLQFIIRALSDRVEFANQEIAALI